MQQLIIPLTAFPVYFKQFQKQPYPCIMNLTPSNGKILVALSTNSDCNTKMIDMYDQIEVLHIGHNGGTIIVFDDSITVFKFDTIKPTDIKPQITKYLSGKNISASITGNDILCNGYKVAGDMYRILDNGFFFYGIHISINANAEIINKLCTKPMEKVPRGLAYYGITRKELLNVLQISDN